MILCTTCLQELDKSCFNKSKTNKDGYDHRCKSCTKDRLKKYRTPERSRASSKRHKKENPIKTNARNKLAYHVKVGNIFKPSQCETCSSTDSIEAHHPDYNYALSVKWLCKECHQKVHHG